MTKNTKPTTATANVLNVQRPKPKGKAKAKAKFPREGYEPRLYTNVTEYFTKGTDSKGKPIYRALCWFHECRRPTKEQIVWKRACPPILKHPFCSWKCLEGFAAYHGLTEKQTESVAKQTERALKPVAPPPTRKQAAPDVSKAVEVAKTAVRRQEASKLSASKLLFPYLYAAPDSVVSTNQSKDKPFYAEPDALFEQICSCVRSSRPEVYVDRASNRAYFANKIVKKGDPAPNGAKQNTAFSSDRFDFYGAVCAVSTLTNGGIANKARAKALTLSTQVTEKNVKSARVEPKPLPAV